jgi:hypothetical protein
MILNDQLPTLSASIVSVLDQRDLYRNHFLTAINYRISESAYQTNKANVDELDLTDLVDLVNQAHSVCENWFLLIALPDVEDTVTEVLTIR